MRKNRKRNKQKRMEKKRMKRNKRRKRAPEIRWITDDMFAIHLDDEDIRRLFSTIIVREIGPDEDEDISDGDVSLS